MLPPRSDPVSQLRAARAALLLAGALAASGCCCSLKKNLINTGNGYDVFGEIQFAGGKKPVRPKQLKHLRHTGLVAALVAPCGGKSEYVYDSSTVDEDPLQGGWHYGVVVPAGAYELLVFADGDQDGVVDRKDLVGRAAVTVAESQADASGMLQGPAVKVDLAHPVDAGFDITIKEKKIPLLWESVSDPFFASKWGRRGLVWPTWTLQHTDDKFLFGLGAEKDGALRLEAYHRDLLPQLLAKRVDKHKVQVLFVHGVDDTPRGFETLSQLDPARYQSWFFFYPTGLGLSDLGATLEASLRALAGHADTVLVAHSMGGLVSRQALKNLAADGAATFPLKGYLSLATPYGGMSSADGMNKIPPELRPYVQRESLFDVQPQSAFLTDLYQGAYPEGLPFYLFYGNAKGDSDGTVATSSATDPRAASRATEVCAYPLDHGDMRGGGKGEATEKLLSDFHKALDHLARGEGGKVCTPAP